MKFNLNQNMSGTIKNRRTFFHLQLNNNTKSILIALRQQKSQKVVHFYNTDKLSHKNLKHFFL